MVYSWGNPEYLYNKNDEENSMTGEIEYEDITKGEKINFLISKPKHMLWVLKRTASMRRFF